MANSETAVICAVTGASGAPLALLLIKALLEHGAECRLVFSRTGARVFTGETGVLAELDSICSALKLSNPALSLYDNGDLFAPIASGSNPWRAMVVCPCSMGTASRIANGASDTLITRAADVAMKESRPLALVPREMPLSRLHLENLAKLAGYGAVIIPPLLTFYHHPAGLEGHISMIISRILVAIGIKNSIGETWKGNENRL